MRLASGLKELRESRRGAYTQEGAAAAIGVSVPTYRKLERNPGLLTMEQAGKLAAYLGCDVSEILMSVTGN